MWACGVRQRLVPRCFAWLQPQGASPVLPPVRRHRHRHRHCRRAPRQRPRSCSIRGKMAMYRRILLLRRLSHLHPSPAQAICSSPPPTLAGLLTAKGCRHFTFSSAEEATAARRLRIESPINVLRRSPQDPNALRVPDTTCALVGPRLSLHNRVQSLIRSDDLDGAYVVARAAVSSHVRPTVFTCNAVAAAMVRAARHDDAVALFDFFHRSSIVPNIVSYNFLILAHCEANRVDTAMQVYRDMLTSAPFSPSAVTYRHLTKGLVAAGRIRDALDLLREMLANNAGADSLVYNNLIAGYIDLDDWDRAFELFNELTERRIVYDGVVHATFMEGYWKQGKDKEAMDNYQSLLERGFKMTAATCNVLLETLFKHGKHKEANDLWETMIDNHSPPSFFGINEESYNVMVNHCLREGKFKEAIDVFHRQPKTNVQMDVGCFNNIIGELCENGMQAEAEKLLRFDVLSRKAAQLTSKAATMEEAKEYLMEEYSRIEKKLDIILSTAGRALPEDIEVVEAPGVGGLNTDQPEA